MRGRNMTKVKGEPIRGIEFGRASACLPGSWIVNFKPLLRQMCLDLKDAYTICPEMKSHLGEISLRVSLCEEF